MLLARAWSTVALLALGTTAGAAACSAAPPTGDARLSQAQISGRPCPLGVPDARVIVDDVAGGVAMTFTAPPERVGELRVRAAHAALRHGPDERAGLGHNGQHGTGGDHGLKILVLPLARTVEQDVDGGARIYLQPAHPEELEVLRAKVRERAEAMMSACR